MKVKKKILLPLTLTTIISAALLALTPRVHATESPILKILPATNTLYINTAPPGTTFSVNITVTNVTDMFSWQVAVGWNSSILNYSSITLPPDHVFAGKTYLPAGPDISTPGKVYYGVSLAPGGIGFNGSGALCQLELKILEPTILPASCGITFEGIPRDTFLLNSLGLDISFTVVHATYTYTLMERVSHTVTYLGSNYAIETYSNASITPNTITVNGTAKMITFNVTGRSGDTAFVNATIPKAFLSADNATAWKVYVNGTQVATAQVQVSENATHTFVYLTCLTSTDTIGIQGTWIVPEMASMFLIIFLIASSAVAVITKTRIKRK